LGNPVSNFIDGRSQNDIWLRRIARGAVASQLFEVAVRHDQVFSPEELLITGRRIERQTSLSGDCWTTHR
jgi:hypothetical protein